MCKCCKKLRQAQGKAPRPLITLPMEVTEDSIFSQREIPLQVCEFCDGDVLELALSGHRARIA